MAPSATSPSWENKDIKLNAKTQCLDVWQESSRPEFHTSMARIMQLRKTYIDKRVIFVEGHEMRDILKGLGAREDDFELLRHSGDLLRNDPTLPFRRTANGRFCTDFDDGCIRRLEHQKFILSAKENFKRHDSDRYREFDELYPVFHTNSAFQALLLFESCVLNGVRIKPRPYQDYDCNKWITTTFHIRTETTGDILGEPALEGVHSDGVDHTMVTLLKHRNMTTDSAITFVHDMREQVGCANIETKGSLVRRVEQHWNFLDTLMIVDGERFHSLTPVEQADPSQDSIRDVIINFTRRPATKGHASENVDSTMPHPTSPLEIPMTCPAFREV